MVIFDLSVPDGIDGKEIIRLLKAFDLTVKAVVSMGYLNNPVVLDFAGYGFP